MATSAISSPSRATSRDGLAIEVVNRSEPVLCAEKDNVTYAFSATNVRSFRVEASHPAYLSSIQRDSYDADWTACDIAPKPGAPLPAPPKRQTLYEEIGFWMFGLTLDSYWRPSTAVVRVGDMVFNNIHLLQLWMIRPMGGEEIVVLYPQDGYWRLRPLAPAGMAPTAFGSSFLVGPLEEDNRPFVRIKEVVFEPKSKTFSLVFERGGTATVRLARTDERVNAVDVGFDKPVAGRPFAMVRSMYVTEFNNDVARIAVRPKGEAGWVEDNVMHFGRATATDVWLGRVTPSRHNLSSPDYILGGFSDTAEPRIPESQKASPATLR